MFVSVRAPNGETLGLAKLIGRTGRLASVEFFDAPTLPPRIEGVNSHLIDTITLPEQTRLYHFSEKLQAWRIGRLIEDYGDSQLVRFPNGEDVLLSVTDVFVRCGAPIADPTPFLAARITETPRFADARSAFVRSVMTQRGAAMGMSALLSAAIELEAHQIEVVRRVLQDPVQRYLLADEVGLGKTIEAGLLIRQCFLDGGPETQVMVIAPAALMAQWRAELSAKFFLADRLDVSLHVRSLDDEQRILSLLPNVSMLVIDEAHRLRRDADIGRPAFFDQVAKAITQLDRLLLLSATPALHNTRGFLEMLHLLDPKTYRIDDEGALQARIASRQTLAEIVASLTPDNTLYLDHSLDQLAELFPEDRLLQEQVAILRAITDAMPGEDDPDLVEALGRVRAHLSEVYRLHRRVLRHRRRSIGGLTPDRAGAEIVDYSSPETTDLIADLDLWRVEDLAPGAIGSLERSEHSSRYWASLTRHFEHTFEPHRSDGEGSADRGSRLSARLGGEGAYRARLEALILALRSKLGDRQQFIVFCSDSATADRIAVDLTDALQIPVDRHSPDEMDWEGFGINPKWSLLVCDRRAEEGLNLQGGRKTIVHWDLPLEPNRIEQRLGRADRYGSGEPVRSLVLRCSGDPYETSWIDYLTSGLRIFSRSVASLQYLIEDSLRGLRATLLEGGPEALADLTQASTGPEGLIEREIRSLDQQDALDALGAPPTSLAEALSDIDDDWRSLQQDTSGWVETTLLFRRTLEAVGTGQESLDTPFRYEYVTRAQQHTLVPLEAFVTHCCEAIDATPTTRRFRAVRTYPLAYRRRTAVGRQGRELRVRLLRYGDPLLSGLYDLAQADDRGRSTAMWRFFPGYQTEGVAELFFRFDFIVECDIAGAVTVLQKALRLTSTARAAIRRRGDMALAPSFHTLWLDADLQEVEDPAVLAYLTTPYRPRLVDPGGRDYNLNPQRWRNMARLDVTALHSWSEVCWAARRTADEALRRRQALTRDLESAAGAAAAADYGRLAQLHTRVERSGDPTEQADLAVETDLSRALLEGVRAPTVRVDGVLAVFVSGDPRAAEIVDSRS